MQSLTHVKGKDNTFFFGFAIDDKICYTLIHGNVNI